MGPGETFLAPFSRSITERDPILVCSLIAIDLDGDTVTDRVTGITQDEPVGAPGAFPASKNLQLAPIDPDEPAAGGPRCPDGQASIDEPKKGIDLTAPHALA